MNPETTTNHHTNPPVAESGEKGGDNMTDERKPTVYASGAAVRPAQKLFGMLQPGDTAESNPDAFAIFEALMTGDFDKANRLAK